MRGGTKIAQVTGLVLFTLVFVVFDRSYCRELKPEEASASQHYSAWERGKGTISVTGEAKEFFAPDTAVITVAVETTEKTAGEAVAENGKGAERVVRALKQLIDPAKGDSIETSSFSVQPVYEYDSATRKSLLTGYRARHQVTVKTGKTEEAGRIIDSAVRSGANEVQAVTFVLRDAKKHCEELLRKAADNARNEAGFVARTLGMKISGIRSVAPSCGTETPRPVYRQTLAGAQAAPVPETAIEAGKIAVHASVAVVFYLGRE
ncbi:MAG: SIMPL domain-containing protein [Nitrospirae bacterium]|nr:SIMPL domain-containing protein [Nitrospirota bacterium]